MFLKIGHRGAGAYEPENTLKSFEKAINLGVNAIEFDVRQTKDKELIVFHDKKIDRLTGDKGFVKNLTLKQIKSLTVGGEPIPTFQEALDFIGKRVEKIFIELKEMGLERKILKEIKIRRMEENAVIVSFLKETLKNFRYLTKDIETGLACVKKINLIKSALKLKTNYLIPFHQLTYSNNISKAHKHDLRVIVWTVNKKEEILEYIKRGVDGIASDRPDILNELSP